MAFFPVPWAFATACSLALVALAAGPDNMITARLTDVSLAAPEAAAALLGKSGAMLLLGMSRSPVRDSYLLVLILYCLSSP